MYNKYMNRNVLCQQVSGMFIYNLKELFSISFNFYKYVFRARNVDPDSYSLLLSVSTSCLANMCETPHIRIIEDSV